MDGKLLHYMQRVLEFIKIMLLRCQTLLKLCLKAGIVQRCGISVLEPNKSIDWHVDTDPTYKDKIIVRGLWGLDINPQGEEVCEIHLENKKKPLRTIGFISFGEDLCTMYIILYLPLDIVFALII